MTDMLVDAGRVVRPQSHFWKSTGFMPADILLDDDMRQTIDYTGSLPRQGIRHVRIHYLLNLVKCRNMETARPEYDWYDLDRGIDILVENGMAPFFELMGNPSSFFSDFCDDGQLRSWRRLVRDLALHLMSRYGRKEVESWYFETWNEPDVGWWHQWPKVIPFCNYYDACSEGLNDANPALVLGGPGTCRTLSPLFKAFLAHCDAGRNYFTGKRGVRLDFISVHEKGANANVEDIDPDNAGITRREIEVVGYIRKMHPRFRNTPFMNNECDPIVGWSQTHTWHGKACYAALLVKVVQQHQKAMIEGIRCPYAILGNDNGFLGGWGLRTLLTRFGGSASSPDGGFELIKKPALNAMA